MDAKPLAWRNSPDIPEGGEGCFLRYFPGGRIVWTYVEDVVGKFPNAEKLPKETLWLGPLPSPIQNRD